MTTSENNNCAIKSLTPYQPSPDTPWDARRIMHLYRRIGFGATPDQVSSAMRKSPSKLVDQLIDEIRSTPLPEAPEWATWKLEQYDDFPNQSLQQYVDWLLLWIKKMTNGGIREKIALFWHNHFVTQFPIYQCPAYLYQYHKILQEEALGNFKTFVTKMGKTPAMLVYLNGVQNAHWKPNENYARELYELFTLGHDNGYTQEDIVETARALTGWIGKADPCGNIWFNAKAHDEGEKTIFGRTGNWGYYHVHNILFRERAEQIAHFICEKIYRHFIHPIPDQTIVEELASLFLKNDFELAPVFRVLFKSQHFFDEASISTQVQSHLDHFISFGRESGFLLEGQLLEVISFQAHTLGQSVFTPTDVAGWPGDRTWINSDTLTGRWQTLRFIIFFIYESEPECLTDLAKQLAGADTSDPEEVTQAFIDYYLPKGLHTAEVFERALVTFKYEIPQNYFDENSWNLSWETVPVQVAFLLEYLVKLPEFQLG